MGLKDWQLGLLSANRHKPVWSVVFPVAPGSTTPTSSRGGQLTYEQAVTVAAEVKRSAPWRRTMCRSIELHCSGKFQSFAG